MISAPSGGGKTTIVKAILRNFSSFKFSVSATTRKKRDGEVDGRDYFFLSRVEFEHRIRAGGLIEYEEIFGNYYGTLKSEVDSALLAGQGIVFDVDVNGGLSIKRQYPDAVLIFVQPPSIEILRQRLSARGTERQDQIAKRMARVPMELEKGVLYDYIVINDVLEQAVEEILGIVIKKLSERSI